MNKSDSKTDFSNKKLREDCKFTEDEVKLIRKEYISYKTPMKKMAAQRNVSSATIYNIVHRIHYKQVKDV